MKKLFLVLAFISISFGFAQEKQNYNKVAATFENNYNNGDIDAIFNMFDDNFKQVLTLEKSKIYFEEQVNMDALGKIKTIVYKDTVRTAHNYTVTFENGVCNAFFMLGDDNKIRSLQLSQIKIKK